MLLSSAWVQEAQHAMLVVRKDATFAQLPERRYELVLFELQPRKRGALCAQAGAAATRSEVGDHGRTQTPTPGACLPLAPAPQVRPGGSISPTPRAVARLNTSPLAANYLYLYVMSQ